MDSPTITTVIPTYRRPALVVRAIRSALAQTYPNVEVVVCDNASGDETREAVSSIARGDSRVKYHCQRENIGFVRNFNFGLSRVETPYFSLLSDDDFLLPEFYEHAVRDLAGSTSAALFIGNTLIRDEIESRMLVTSRRLVEAGFYEAPMGFRAILHEDTLRMWTGMVFPTREARTAGCLDEAMR